MFAFWRLSLDHSTPASFCLIILTSWICKLFENMVNVCLVHFLKQGGHHSSAQWGFCFSHSTLDALFYKEHFVSIWRRLIILFGNSIHSHCRLENLPSNRWAATMFLPLNVSDRWNGSQPSTAIGPLQVGHTQLKYRFFLWRMQWTCPVLQRLFGPPDWNAF